MAQKTRTELKAYFNTGDTPTEAQFQDLIDSMVNKTDDGVPKIYRAVLNQSGTSAPTVTVLHNDFKSTFVWSYNGVGDYRLTSSASDFLAAKTYLGGCGLDPDNAAFSKAIRSSDTIILLNSFEATTYPIETLADSKMVNVMFELIVYP